MKPTKPTVLVFVGLVLALNAYCQGKFVFGNGSAPTRIGAIDGPLAGVDIWAHMFAGAAPDSLSPVGPDYPHYGNGLVLDGNITLPGMPEGSVAYVQMAAWDSRLWGTNLVDVPPAQLGKTDIGPVVLGGSILPIGPPNFTQPAVVPIPEPSRLILGILAGTVCWFGRRRVTV